MVQNRLRHVILIFERVLHESRSELLLRIRIEAAVKEQKAKKRMEGRKMVEKEGEGPAPEKGKDPALSEKKKTSTLINDADGRMISPKGWLHTCVR